MIAVGYNLRRQLQRYLEKKEEQEERQAVEAQRLKQMARRELEWLRRGPKARTTKAKARVDRANELIQQSRQAASEIAGKRSLDIVRIFATGREDTGPARRRQILRRTRDHQ